MTDDPAGSSEDRVQAVRTALDGVFEEGEVFLVARQDDAVLALVPRSPAAHREPSLADSNPELYGRLLSFDGRQVDPPGEPLGWVFVLAAVLLVVALEAGWPLPGISPEDAATLHSWWIYVGLAILSFFAKAALTGALRRLAWLGDSARLQSLLRREGLDADALKTALKDNDKLGHLLARLQREGAGATSRG